jgi:hypothetical protein
MISIMELLKVELVEERRARELLTILPKRDKTFKMSKRNNTSWIRKDGYWLTSQLTTHRQSYLKLHLVAMYQARNRRRSIERHRLRMPTCSYSQLLKKNHLSG